MLPVRPNHRKYSKVLGGGRSARVPLPKLGPCLSGGPNHWAVNRGNTPERTPHLVLGVESASVGYIMRPEVGVDGSRSPLYIRALHDKLCRFCVKV